jgi:hypothetical protein
MRCRIGGLFFDADRSYVWGARSAVGPAQENVVTPTQFVQQPTRGAMPGRVRWGVIGAIGLALAGALYLLSVRGEALLLDLQTLGRVFCF